MGALLHFEEHVGPSGRAALTAKLGDGELLEACRDGEHPRRFASH